MMASLEALMAKMIEVPLDAQDREVADGFAALAGPLAERVRRNTLAVLAVQRYLTWQGFATDLSNADAWHPALRLTMNVADLPLVGLGRLECLVVSPGATGVEVPLEVGAERLAYMVMELAAAPLAGRLLGFWVPEGELVEFIEVAELADMDEFIERLCRWQLGVAELAEFEGLMVPEDLAERLALVVRLERVYVDCAETDWGYEVVDALQACGTRGATSATDGIGVDELQRLGGRLMGQLACRWRELD